MFLSSSRVESVANQTATKSTINSQKKVVRSGNTAPPRQLIRRNRKETLNLIGRNGRLAVDPAGGEFTKYVTSLSFESTPKDLDAAWFELLKAPVTKATWILYEPDLRLPSGQRYVASGPITSLPQSTDKGSLFTIELEGILGTRNLTEEDKHYVLQVSSQTGSSGQDQFSTRVYLTHLAPQDPEPLRDAYACPEAAITNKEAFDRKVSVVLPDYNVIETTSGEGPTDEVYMWFLHRGPGEKEEGRERLPKFRTKDNGDPERDNNYYKMREDNIKDEWYDRTDEKVDPPTHNIKLQHGESRQIAVTMQDSDFKFGSKLKDWIKDIIEAIGEIAGATNTPEGEAVGVGANVASKLFDNVEVTNDDDFIGGFVVTLENRCGYIKQTLSSQWRGLTLSKGDGQVFRSVLNIPLSHRPDDIVLSMGGWDFGEFQAVGDEDALRLTTRGTGNSHYTFGFKTIVSKPN